MTLVKIAGASGGKLSIGGYLPDWAKYDINDWKNLLYPSH
jgi:hypothetical protein